MQIFYANDICGDRYILNTTESKHIVKVLRMVNGDKVNIIDGKGNLYECSISDANIKGCEVCIDRVIADFDKRDYRLSIAISPLKNSDRFEWFVEKAVEIGVDTIFPIVCRYTERPTIKEERINNIIVSAMKQSLKATAVTLNPLISFDEFIDSRFQEKSVKMIAHCYSDIGEKSGISDIYHRGEDAIIMIGPEGDFSIDEVRKATTKGFSPISLGRSRLRTETAGIAACHSVYFINQFL